MKALKIISFCAWMIGSAGIMDLSGEFSTGRDRIGDGRINRYFHNREGRIWKGEAMIEVKIFDDGKAGRGEIRGLYPSFLRRQ